ncbi:MAG: hypothetical protein F4207_14980 [Gemmatimonadetes bacterium]|nr:hypothetical protein [Gemmatimonadota bacterium]MYH17777.1 hypothetical protein [Gemmatimonadota bacterium]
MNNRTNLGISVRGISVASIWCFLFAMHVSAKELDQSTEEGRYAELCRYYVAYFEYETTILYYGNWLVRGVSVNVEEAPDDKIQLDRPESVKEALTKLAMLWFPTLDRIKDYRCELQPRKFMVGIDVYLAYSPSSPESYPYKLGIREGRFAGELEFLNPEGIYHFIKFNGFEERIRFPGDTTAFVSYNHQFEYPKLKDVPRQSRESVDEFVTDWIQLTQYKGHPRDFELLFNDFELTDDTLVGRCETVELDMESGQNALYLHKVWTYEISSSDVPILERVSLRSAGIQHDELKP